MTNMNLNSKQMLGAGAALAVLLFVIYRMVLGLNYVSTDDAFIEGRIHVIAPKIPGTVKDVKVEDNQNVKEGDLLVDIDPVDFELKVSEARASLDMRAATLEQAERDKVRAENLFKDGVLPKDKYENILTAYDLSKAQTESAEAQLKIAQRNLEYTKISSPANGRVTKKSVEVGNQVLPGQSLMAVVSSDMWVVANYKETQLKDVRPGQEVKIRVDTYPGKVFEGHVDSIQRGTGAKFSLFPPENAAGNFVKVVQRIPVKIVFDNQPADKYDLSIGMSVVPEIKVR